MRRTALLAAILVTGLLGLGAGDQRRAFGQPLQIKAAVELASLTRDPRDFAGKTVRVEGLVVQVDQDKGAWLDIADDFKGLRIRIRMQDGNAEFPIDAKGSHVVAEGLVGKPELTGHSDSLTAAEDLGSTPDKDAQRWAAAQVAAEMQARGVVLE